MELTQKIECQVRVSAIYEEDGSISCKVFASAPYSEKGSTATAETKPSLALEEELAAVMGKIMEEAKGKLPGKLANALVVARQAAARLGEL